MNRERTIRALRITTSGVCSILCALLVALWIRSYHWQDYAHCPLPGKSINPSVRRLVRLPDGTEFEPAPRMLTMSSGRGRLSIRAGEANPYRSGIFPWGWGLERTSVDNLIPSTSRPRPRWDYTSDRFGRYILFPHWAPALVFAALAAAFGVRLPNRFSLRTLLILTTLVAAILGLVVWASGQ
jgi:hypothetical protein